MRPLTFALLVGFSNAAIASLFGGYSVSGHMNQKHYEFKVSEADIPSHASLESGCGLSGVTGP